MFPITSSADDQGKKNINEILGPKIIGVDVKNQVDFDAIMLEIDGTPNKSKWTVKVSIFSSLPTHILIQANTADN
ncbi:hypothetical protein L2E82_31594 [Cichorium intybus]|uniref:Uncharacterized protein n=1 Tax=Cichorium intybus TaxID=13427 RepID=A0ACB9BEH2_CICIN|nr:hypothetical protein L2E82_31594 [Cichorium intybus]